MKPTEYNGKLNFYIFKENHFNWCGLQTIKEITKEEALIVAFTKQKNWISKYLEEKGVL
jgi:hypothetical protein